jgi:hypothetical protein
MSRYKSAILREDEGVVYLDIKKSNVESSKLVIDPKKISDFIALLIDFPGEYSERARSR